MPARESVDSPRRPAEVSRSFEVHEFVFHIMKLDEPGTDWLVLKMKLDCFLDVGAQLIPRLRLSEDSVPESAGEKAAFLSIADFED